MSIESSKRNGSKNIKVLDKYLLDGTNVKNLTMKKRKDNKSGIKGVSFDKERGKWAAQICFKGKNYHLGRYERKDDAFKARKEAEDKLFGNFLKYYHEK